MFLVIAALFALMTQSALAYTVTATGNGGDAGNGYGPYQTGIGGEFTFIAGDGLQFVLGSYGANAKGIVQDGTFQTFCLETNEHIWPNSVNQAVLNTGAVSGGVGGATNGFDPISIGTAWLYSQFAQGTLAGYDYSAVGRKTSAAALQNTIWWLEGEQTDPGNTNIFRNAVLGEYTTANAAMANSNGAFGVKVLNLTVNGEARQDMLVATPIPAAIWLFGAGLLGLVGVRRRFTA